MEERISDLEQQEVLLSSELNGLQLQLGERQRAVDAAQDNVDRLTAGLAETEAELRDLRFSSREELSNLQLKLAQVSHSADATSEELEGTVATHEAMKARHADLEHTLHQTNHELATAQLNVHNLSLQLKEAKQQVRACACACVCVV
jgi:chromosome segregation ATPase